MSAYQGRVVADEIVSCTIEQRLVSSGEAGQLSELLSFGVIIASISNLNIMQLKSLFLLLRYLIDGDKSVSKQFRLGRVLSMRRARCFRRWDASNSFLSIIVPLLSQPSSSARLAVSIERTDDDERRRRTEDEKRSED